MTGKAMPVAIVMASPLGGAMAACTDGGAMIEIALSIVTGPYPAESMTTTSAPGLETVTARPNVRHGAGRVQSFVSTPNDATQLRVFWASDTVEKVQIASK